MDSRSSQIQILDDKAEFKLLFISIIFGFTFAAFLRRFTELGLIKSASVVSWLICMAIFLTPAGILIFRFKHPLSNFGITKVGLLKSIRNALILCLFFFILLAFIGGITNDARMIVFFRLPCLGSLQMVGLQSVGFYLLMAFFQEFLARGMMQSYIQKFLDDNVGYLSNFLNSLVFTTLHSHEKLLTVIGVFCLSLLLGEIYLREKNLAGVTILHFFLGTAAGYLRWL